MKINTYPYPLPQQRINRPNAPAPRPETPGSVVISPQPTDRSSLAVPAKGADPVRMLAPEERQALELLFARFREAGRFAPAMAAADEADPGLGRIIDVKV